MADSERDTSILEELKVQRRNTPRHLGTEYFSPCKDNPHAPALRDEIIGKDQEILEGLKDVISSHTKDYKYGTPTTREEFDRYYEYARSKGINTKIAFELDEQMLLTKGALETSAADTAQVIRFLPLVFQTAKAYPDIVSKALKSLNHQALGPASVNLQNLDPRLTEEEKISVRRHAKEASLLCEMLVSHKDSAPEKSPWAQRLHKEAAQKFIGGLLGGGTQKS